MRNETDYYSRSSFRNPIAGDSLTDLMDNFHNVTSLRVLRSGLLVQFSYACADRRSLQSFS